MSLWFQLIGDAREGIPVFFSVKGKSAANRARGRNYFFSLSRRVA